MCCQGTKHTVQIPRSFEPGFEVSPKRAYLSPPLARGLIEARLASENNPPAFMCSHCLAPVDASGVWEFSFCWEIKRRLFKFTNYNPD